MNLDFKVPERVKQIAELAANDYVRMDPVHGVSHAGYPAVKDDVLYLLAEVLRMNSELQLLAAQVKAYQHEIDDTTEE